ncbi:UNC-like C-terminal-domain-containing protein [Zychaea mexicana]|uniref:UNC-like C-terminal-domain-containing protein n=1 Tax=Zychaea mexicana TaxID=64656 RepID=UPI0022FDD7C7|nr:UNC-like C-terminal-domain-containing protein [Zychaea mexicana]KAI9491170.1 UNC-like C-terminal-domain-containing protein [Zychaea mexicana]
MATGLNSSNDEPLSNSNSKKKWVLETLEDFLEQSSPTGTEQELNWFDDTVDDDISDTDPLEELDALANNHLDEEHLRDYDLSFSREDGPRMHHTNDNNSSNSSVKDGSSSSSSINRSYNSSRSNIDGILWPIMRPVGEMLYEKVAFALFMVVYSIKETVLAWFAFIDAAMIYIYNFVLKIMQSCGVMRNRPHGNPLRMLGQRKQSQRIFCWIAVGIYLWMFYAYLHRDQSSVIVKSNTLYDSFYHIFNGHDQPQFLSPESPLPHTAPSFPAQSGQQQPDSSTATGMLIGEENAETIRATVERILSSFVPGTTNGKQMDFISNLQAYMNDHYVKRTELQEKQLSSPPSSSSSSSSSQDKYENAEHKQELFLQQVADFALATRGARIIPKMTSSTYSTSNRHLWKAAIARAVGIHPGTYRASPLIALLPDTHVGQCWPMTGTNGTLGIMLSQPIAIKSVTLEYPDREQTVNTSSAPHAFEIWGLHKVEVPVFSSVQWPWSYPENDKDTNSKLLGSFQYDVQTGRSVQTFNVNNEHDDVFEAVVIRILSNWGQKAYTCLYRVRVHGEAL